jgi:hypothetical protein
MAQTYTFDLPAGKPADALVERARQAGKGKGITLVGDGRSGSFTGTATGSYTVDAGKITITVDKKPTFVPWGMIENALRDVFSKA